MPTYEYECKKCGRVFDHFQSMSSPVLTVCPAELCADKGEVKRHVGAGSGLIFKGSGFYITDYKNKSGSPTGGGGSDSKGGESKSGGSGGEKSAPATPAAPAAAASGSSSGSSSTSGSSAGSGSGGSSGSGSGSSS